MPDNVQFIYGKLIEIHRAGLLVYALISLNQQTIYSALMCSSRRPLPHLTPPVLPSTHATHLTLILMYANKPERVLELLFFLPRGTFTYTVYEIEW